MKVLFWLYVVEIIIPALVMGYYARETLKVRQSDTYFAESFRKGIAEINDLSQTTPSCTIID